MTESRRDGTVRFMFCQLNNISTKGVRELKLRSMNFLAKTYDVGIRMFNEHRWNRDNTQK